MLASLIEWDFYIQGLINQECTNSFVDWIMPYWRDKKTWIPLYLSFVIGLIWKYKWKGFAVIVIVVVVIGLSDFVSSELIKKSIERLRPCRTPEIMDQVRMLVNCGGGYSFTSSHATNHFALAMILYHTLHRQLRSGLYWSVLFLWAGSIAYGQAYVGVHFPFDILCGSLLGIGIATFVYFVLYRQLPKKYRL